jgi:hypothetical protein
MGLVLDPDTVVAQAARRQREVRLPSPRDLPIDTFVVLMMENRTFDHYLPRLAARGGRAPGRVAVHHQRGPEDRHPPPDVLAELWLPRPRRRAPAAPECRCEAVAPASVVLAALAVAGVAQPAPALAAPPPIRHVFIIVLENESASTTFGPGSPAPYLSRTLTAQGANLPHYYGVGHQSNDNYIAMISGQAPNAQNQADCQIFSDFIPSTIGSYGQVQGTGCVYPAGVPTIAGQLSAAGLTWRDYNDGMGADPSREPVECAHPAIGAAANTQSATAADQYATRHNPLCTSTRSSTTRRCATRTWSTSICFPTTWRARPPRPITCSSRPICAMTATTRRAPTAGPAASGRRTRSCARGCPRSPARRRSASRTGWC